MSNVFVGVIIVAVIGNAAGDSTAVLAAMRNRMDLSLGIAIGSSTQVALLDGALTRVFELPYRREPDGSGIHNGRDLCDLDRCNDNSVHDERRTLQLVLPEPCC
jgi:hypothetical protein